VTPGFNVQAEVRTRKTEQGDLLLNFDPDIFSARARREVTQDTARVGARYSLSPRQDVIASVIYTDRSDFMISAGSMFFDTYRTTRDQGYQAEAQYLFRENYFNLAAGVGTYGIDVDQQTQQHIIASGVDRCGGIRSPFPCSVDFSRERSNAYLYTNFNFPRAVTTTLGFSYDSYKVGLGRGFEQLNPKLGLQWDITDNIRLRLAWFEMVKPALTVNQTLEPTQVAGFNQMFDDLNGTKARRKGIGLDTKITRSLYAGLELSERDLEVFGLADLMLRRVDRQHERLYRVYFYWLPNNNWAFRGEYQFEKFTRELKNIDDPILIETTTAPVSLNYFNPYGLFSRLTGTYVRQNLERWNTTRNEGTSDFFLLDAALGYRFPNRRGILSFEGRNLLDQDFSFRSVNFQTNEAISPRFIPGRSFFVRLTLNF
jgi:hypothetical protein